jgi:uncharacterized protein YutE (UPF0331/DUF86 family)
MLEVNQMWIREQDRKRIRPYLKELRNQSKRLQESVNLVLKSDGREDELESNHEILYAAMERALHIGSECITDIGNMIIDTCIMRDPSSYQDIVTVLHDENVLDDALYDELLLVIGFRKNLVHDYLEIDRNKVLAFAKVAIRAFSSAADQLEYFTENSR